MAKRPSLKDIAAKKPGATSVDKPEGGDDGTDERRPAPYKAILTKIDRETWVALKALAVELDRPMADLQLEALNDLLAKHGKPQIARRVVVKR